MLKIEKKILDLNLWRTLGQTRAGLSMETCYKHLSTGMQGQTRAKPLMDPCDKLLC